MKPDTLIAKISLAIIPALVTLTACNDMDRRMERYGKDPMDWEANLSRDEIKEAMRPQRPELEKDKTAARADGLAMAGIPPFSPVIMAPDEPDINSTRRVSLTLTENINLKEVLLELARLAELELALDPNIRGGIILSVNNRPVKEVIEMVCELAGLRYSVDNNVLKVVKDSPYMVNYNVDFLNLIRSSKGTISTQTQVLSSSSSGSSGSGSSGSSGSSSSGSSTGGLTSGSSNALTTETDGDLWKSVEGQIRSIIESDTVALKTANNSTVAIQPVAQLASALASVAGGGSATGDAATKSAVPPTQPSAIPVAEGAPADEIKPYYAINKQASIISVMAGKRKQDAVRDYIEKVRESMSAQVLIEAKIIEVALADQFQGGIDWNKIAGQRFNITTLKASALDANSGVFSDTTASKIFGTPVALNLGGGKGPSPAAIVNMVEAFGLTRTLSNPRVTVMNNQQAVFTFAKNQTYYTVTGTPQTQTAATATTGATTLAASITSTLNTIPIGVILTLQPSIDLRTQEVTMHIRPTLSTVAGTGPADPAALILASSIPSATGGNSITESAIQSALTGNTVPIIQVRELDTVLKAKSGEVMVIGGLISHADASAEIGVPFLSEIPILGRLVKSTEKNSQVTETVILLQATIIPSTYYHKQDKRVYETFAQDPRPLVFN